MGSTIIELAQQVAEEAGVKKPSVVVETSAHPGMPKMRAAFRNALEELGQYPWPATRTEYGFHTSAETLAYGLPGDFTGALVGTQYNRGASDPMYPLDPAGWQLLKADNDSPYYDRYRLQATVGTSANALGATDRMFLEFFEMPGTGERFAFSYQSNWLVLGQDYDVGQFQGVGLSRPVRFQTTNASVGDWPVGSMGAFRMLANAATTNGTFVFRTPLSVSPVTNAGSDAVLQLNGLHASAYATVLGLTSATATVSVTGKFVRIQKDIRADTDTLRLDDGLVRQMVAWNFRRLMGMRYAEDQLVARRNLARLSGSFGQANNIRLGRTQRDFSGICHVNLPHRDFPT